MQRQIELITCPTLSRQHLLNTDDKKSSDILKFGARMVRSSYRVELVVITFLSSVLGPCCSVFCLFVLFLFPSFFFCCLIMDSTLDRERIQQSVRVSPVKRRVRQRETLVSVVVSIDSFYCRNEFEVLLFGLCAPPPHPPFAIAAVLSSSY